MNPDSGEKLKLDKKRAGAAEKHMQKQEVRRALYEKDGKGPEERLFPDLHASLFGQEDNDAGTHAALPERALEGPALSGLSRIAAKDDIRFRLADALGEMQDYLEPQGRSASELKAVRDRVFELDKALEEASGAPGGLSGEMKELHKDIRKKKRQLDRLAERNTPVDPAALRSFDEVRGGIASGDASGLLVSGMMEEVSGVLTGNRASVRGMSTEDLENIVNEVDAMTSRHRYSKSQQALGLMEQESTGDIITRPNRVLQEAGETDRMPQVRRETGRHEEKEELFENRKGQEEHDALGKKHDILKDITRANRNNIRQKQAKDGLEAVRSMMHNGERKRGFAPIAAMGLGGNLYKGFTGMNFMMSMTSNALDRHGKHAAIRSVTERYLGLDQLYRSFMTKNSDIRNRAGFISRYGRESNVNGMIRKEQEKASDAGPGNRMNSFIMKKYAEQLWRGAFLKEDGSVITDLERRREAPEKRQRRKLYADMLRAMGFSVRYPAARGGLPGTSRAEIFRRLML